MPCGFAGDAGRDGLGPGHEERWMLGETYPALLLTSCRLATPADMLAPPSPGRGTFLWGSVRRHFAGHLHGNADHASAFPSASMGSRVEQVCPMHRR